LGSIRTASLSAASDALASTVSGLGKVLLACTEMRLLS
jgi:hypothetical protein